MKKANFQDFFYISVDDLGDFKRIMFMPRSKYTNYILFERDHNYPLKIKWGILYANQPKDIINLYAIPSIEKYPHNSQD